MKNIAGPAHHSGFTHANDLRGQGTSSQPQTPANPNVQLPQTARSGPNLEDIIRRKSIFGKVNYHINRPARLTPRAEALRSSRQDLFLSTASEPLLSRQSKAVLTSAEQYQARDFRPVKYKEYCAQWDAWKNEVHSSDENRTAAVERMKSLLNMEINLALITPTDKPIVITPKFFSRNAPPAASCYSTLDLSSLGLSSLPPWLPKARTVNLDHNRLTEFPTNLLTHLTDRREALIVKPEIRLTHNPLPNSEINRLQSIMDHSGYEGPTLVLPKPVPYEPIPLHTSQPPHRLTASIAKTIHKASNLTQALPEGIAIHTSSCTLAAFKA